MTERGWIPWLTLTDGGWGWGLRVDINANSGGDTITNRKGTNMNLKNLGQTEMGDTMTKKNLQIKVGRCYYFFLWVLEQVGNWILVYKELR